MAPTTFPTDAERLRAFGLAIDAIRTKVEAKLGAEDVTYVRRVDALSKAMQVVGRTLIHFSLDPVTFSAGVAALWIHKQLEAAEIGHNALHGSWDGLAGAEKFDSKTFHWDMPVDEACWHEGHNVRHHQYTNISGRDADIHFGGLRLTRDTPQPRTTTHRVPFVLLATFPQFSAMMNIHFSGLADVYAGKGQSKEHDFIPDRSAKSILHAHQKAFRKFVPYYLRNFVLFPALAGPFFAKVLFGNWLAEVMRDLYLASSIFCGHIGEDIASYPEGTRAHSRGEWYAMQAEASSNFDVRWSLSVLCGALDRQIEHHLFPRLPPNRLREVSADVRAACEAHGVRYRSNPWPRALAKAFTHLVRLTKQEVGAAVPVASLGLAMEGA